MIYLFNKVVKYIFIISIAVKIILLILGVILNLYLIGIHTSNIINFIILISALLSILDIKDKTESNIIQPIFIPIIIILMLINSVVTMFFFDNQEYIFNSPNSKNAIILDESTFLNTTNYDIYDKKFSVFKEDLHKSINTDESRSFDINKYSIKWKNEDIVTIKYNYLSGVIHSDEITIKLK